MWKYTPKVMDHFLNPRNVGEMENPDAHKNLIVRVGGYSDYFVNISEELQNNVIERTFADI